MKKFNKGNVTPHPTSVLSKDDRAMDRENLARQMRTSQMMREMAREQINPTQQITEIMEIDMQLQGEMTLNDDGTAGVPIPLEREVIAALRARADIKFRLLDKVLPNLKATESLNLSMHDHQGTIGIKKVSDVELAARLQNWRKNHGSGHLRRAIEEGTESCVEATFTEEPKIEDLL